MRTFAFLFFILISLDKIFAHSQKENEYVKLKSSEINCRVGPGKEYPRCWVLKRAHLPAKLITKFYQWRKIRLYDGTEGWVHQNMIVENSDSALVTKETFLYSSPSQKSPPIAKVEKNVILKVYIQKNKDKFILAEKGKFKGWIDKSCLTGIDI